MLTGRNRLTLLSRLPSRHCVAMVTMMMPLSTRRDGILRPERAIQEMATRECRTSHSRYRRDACAEGRRIRTTSTHAQREHTIEHCPFVHQQKKKHEARNLFVW